MEKVKYSQLELFSESKDYAEVKTRAAHKLFLGYIRNYEKVILIIIGFTITGIISFSLGIEKGKKLIGQTVQVKPVIEKQALIKEPVRKDSLYNYTIQVASYQSKISAQKEVDRLRKKGHLPLVLSKGKYRVVCVGNFSDKKMATTLVLELKKQYRDCFIRRL